MKTFIILQKDNTKINREAVGVPYKWKCNLIDRKTGKHRIKRKLDYQLKIKVKVIVGLFPMILLSTLLVYHPATFPMTC